MRIKYGEYHRKELDKFLIKEANKRRWHKGKSKKAVFLRIKMVKTKIFSISHRGVVINVKAKKSPREKQYKQDIIYQIQ